MTARSHSRDWSKAKKRAMRAWHRRTPRPQKNRRRRHRVDPDPPA